MNNQLERLHTQIRSQLDMCDEDETPAVCQMKQTNTGYEELKNLIVQKVLYGENISISDAIVEIENEYNINAID